MRRVDEWIGKTDDTRIPAGVKRRLLEKQQYACASCHLPFHAKRKPECHHVKSIEGGGENREGNLEMWCRQCHQPETNRQASVRAKVNAVLAHRFDLKPSRSPFSKPAGYKYNWKRRRYERES